MATLTPERIEQIIKENIDSSLYPRKVKVKYTDVFANLKIIQRKSNFATGLGFSFNLSFYIENGSKIADAGTFFVLPCKHKNHDGVDVAYQRTTALMKELGNFVCADFSDVEQRWKDFAEMTALDVCKAIAQEQGNYIICDPNEDHSIAKYRFYLCADV